MVALVPKKFSSKHKDSACKSGPSEMRDVGGGEKKDDAGREGGFLQRPWCFEIGLVYQRACAASAHSASIYLRLSG